MQSKVLPPVRINTKLDEELDLLVQDGHYGSKSDAIRDALRVLIREHRRPLPEVSIESPVSEAKESRRELWQRCLDEAQGDAHKAAELLKEKVL